MTGLRTMGRAGRSKAGGDSSTRLGRQGGAPKRSGKALGVTLAVLACLAVGAALLLTGRAAPDRPPPNWALVVCDVGQGDGMLLADGPHAAIVIDTGPDPAAEDRCLKRFQVTTVPLLILTHFHADHIGGLSAVLADARVREIETTTVDIPPAGAAEVRAEAAAAGVPVHPVTPHERRRYGAVSWQVLWPDPAFPLSPDGNAPEDHMPGMDGTSGMDGISGTDGSDRMSADKGGGESPGPNNTSMVMAVTIDRSSSGSGSRSGPASGTVGSGSGFGSDPASGTVDSGSGPAPGTTDSGSNSGADPPLRILLTGDIEQPVQADLLSADRSLLRADILKVPHHGSANQDPDFVRAVDPSVSIISVGVGNPYGHPVARTVQLMGSTGARLYRTDLDGAVVVSFPPTSDAGYVVTAEHGDGHPSGAPIGPNPGSGSRGHGFGSGSGSHGHGSGSGDSDYYGSDQQAPSRRSGHRHSKGHSYRQ